MSTLKLPPFEYFEPGSIAEAAQLLAMGGDSARVLAGGIDLIPGMRAGSVAASRLVSLQRLKELDYIRTDADGAFGIGAMASLHSLERSAELASRYPALHEAIRQITSVQTKYMGTAVGNLCVGTPASDLGPALAVLDAEVIIAGTGSTRRVALGDFYPGYRRTALQPGELVTGVRIPPGPRTRGAAFLNLLRTHADIAKVTVSAAVSIEKGTCRGVRIALGSVAPTMYRARTAEALLEGKALNTQSLQAAGRAALQEAAPIEDVRSTAEYRREVSQVLVRRALRNAAERSAGISGEPLPPLE